MPASDLAGIAEEFGIPDAPGPIQLRDALYDVIRTQIVAPSPVKDGLDLRSLHSALARRFLFKVDGEPHQKLAEWILFGVNEKYFRPLSERAPWLKAIRAVYALMAVPGHEPTEVAGRDTAVSRAALNLQARAYDMRLEGGQFVFVEGAFERCCADVDRRIQRLGGRFVIHKLLLVLQGTNRFVRGRYLVGRNASTVPGPADPAVPFGYLLNVALRHMHHPPSVLHADKEWAGVIALAGDLIAVGDVENYSTYGFLFTDHQSLPKYLERLLVGDFWLSLRQLIAKDALSMIRGLFNWIDPAAIKAQLGWTVADAVTLAENVLGNVDPAAINHMFHRHDLAKNGLSAKVLDKMLPAFTHRVDELNRDFHTPLQSSAAIFDQKPLVWQPGQKLLMVSPALCALGFFEALASAARLIDAARADNLIGLAIEPFLANTFSARGVAPAIVSGKYKVGSTTYDCDLAIQSKDAVMLFEIKKKSLTRAAIGGSVLEGLIDLSKSMIKAQTQLGYQEIQLLKEGKIAFVNGATLELRGRRIERIAVTLLDWGSIQYRTIVDNIYKVLVSATWGATGASDKQNKSVAEGNALLALLQTQARELTALKGSERQPFFDWHFLGIPQILFLLDGVGSADEFYANLKTAKHAVTGSLDFYETLAYMQQIKAVANPS